MIRFLCILGMVLFSFGLASLGITYKTPAFWFLIVGLALYVTFGK